ncbi:MAG: methyltransferase domain-containing protein [Candidatus Acidiferrales bacterium]
MISLDAFMSSPRVYRLWMAPFAEKKFAPVAVHNDLGRVRRVLDVGCGPGTNTRHFSAADYLGIDLNGKYIRDAQQHSGKRFLVADAAKFVVAPDERFDFILINSFLHHIDDVTTRSILSNLKKLLTRDGHIHILELVMPKKSSVALFLAHSDRGNFPRPLEVWRQMFEKDFEPVVFEPYDLGALGIPFWKMIYFKGRARS